jgi:hypothetical protein
VCPPSRSRRTARASPRGVSIAPSSSGTRHGDGLAFTPDGLFVGGADPREASAIVRGLEFLALDEFITLNRRDSLAEALKETVAAK